MPASTRHILRAIAGLVALVTLPAASAQRVNFAKFQQAAANVANSSYAADFAVDGIASNFSSWRTGNQAGPHWLELTYPRPVTLASAHVYSGQINATNVQLWQNFRFQSHDGTTWVDIPGSTVSGNTDPERVVIFATPATSTRFRLLGSDANNRTLRELSLFPPNLVGGIEQSHPIGTDVTLNLARQRPTLASSAVDGVTPDNFAKKAVDGFVDDSSRWLCTAAIGETLEIDLLESQTVGSAHLYSGFGNGNALADCALDWWDGTAWQPVPGGTITGNTQQARNVLFSTAVTTSKIRLRMTAAQNARLRELLLFPPREGGYPIGQDVTIAPPPTDDWQRFGDFSRGLRCGISEDRRLGLVHETVVFAGGGAGNDALRWQLLYNYRNHTFRIRHAASGHCLALENISMTTGNRVVIEPYTGLPHQEWRLDPVIDIPGRFRLLNHYSGHALQSSGSWNLGTPMVVATSNPAATLQHWYSQGTPVHHPKKGLAATNNATPWNPGLTWLQNAYQVMPHSSWSYSWGRQTRDAFPYMAPATHTFNPMQWGNFNFDHGSNAGPIDLMRRDFQSNPNPVYLMGFNEPDGSGQANMTVAAAIARWPRLEAMDVPLASPAPAGNFNGWLADFFTQADQLGYRVDHTAIHWYKAPDVDNLINEINQAHTTWGRPVWLTEFSTVRWSGTATWTPADNFNFLAEFLWRAESIPHLARYSLFQFRAADPGVNQSAPDPAEAPRSNTYNNDGTLTAFGQLYAGWDGVTNISNNKAYHLHNRDRYRRVHNPAAGNDTIASISPETATTGLQWFLIPGITENTVRICSTQDGRKIRFYTGVQPGLAAATNEQTQTEWRTVSGQHGWFFIEHPQTNQRLRINASNALVMGPIGSTGNDYQWRFVVPAAPEPTAIPSVPAGLAAQPTTSQITLTWQAAAGALTYIVQRATDLAGPWTHVATGLTNLEWINSGLPYATTYHYRITATNNLGTSAPSEILTATTPHENETFETWASVWLDDRPVGDQQPGADPDNDGLNNLLEHVFLTDPEAPGGNPLKTGGITGNTLELTFPWNWRATGYTWQLRHGTDLADRASWPVVAPGIIQAVRDGDVDHIRIAPAMAHPGRGFYVLEIISP